MEKNVVGTERGVGETFVDKSFPKTPSKNFNPDYAIGNKAVLFNFKWIDSPLTKGD